jgi:hypothetical protein
MIDGNDERIKTIEVILNHAKNLKSIPYFIEDTSHLAQWIITTSAKGVL